MSADCAQLFSVRSPESKSRAMNARCIQTSAGPATQYANFRNATDAPPEAWTDGQVYAHVVETTRRFCPEATGIRGHSLFYDSELLSLYRKAGIEYDSSCSLPLMGGLRPIWKEYSILEFPVYYIDHFDLKSGRTGFELEGLGLNRPGLKVFDFHPNIVFINASTDADYQACRPFYHDYERLLKFRRPGRGARTLFLELIDEIARGHLPTITLGELNQRYRITSNQRITSQHGYQDLGRAI